MREEATKIVDFTRYAFSKGGMGISFQFTTISPEVVERHLIFAYYEAAQRVVLP
jgi:hypothetical protein